MQAAMVDHFYFNHVPVHDIVTQVVVTQWVVDVFGSVPSFAEVLQKMLLITARDNKLAGLAGLFVKRPYSLAAQDITRNGASCILFLPSRFHLLRGLMCHPRSFIDTIVGRRSAHSADASPSTVPREWDQVRF